MESGTHLLACVRFADITHMQVVFKSSKWLVAIGFEVRIEYFFRKFPVFKIMVLWIFFVFHKHTYVYLECIFLYHERWQSEITTTIILMVWTNFFGINFFKQNIGFVSSPLVAPLIRKCGSITDAGNLVITYKYLIRILVTSSFISRKAQDKDV